VRKKKSTGAKPPARNRVSRRREVSNVVVSMLRWLTIIKAAARARKKSSSRQWNGLARL
jgi:hypothetical protein